jgi:hypothetical protein
MTGRQHQHAVRHRSPIIGVRLKTVKDLVASSSLRFEEARQHELKAIPDRWHVDAVS